MCLYASHWRTERATLELFASQEEGYAHALRAFEMDAFAVLENVSKRGRVVFSITVNGPPFFAGHHRRWQTAEAVTSNFRRISPAETGRYGEESSNRPVRATRRSGGRDNEKGPQSPRGL